MVDEPTYEGQEHDACALVSIARKDGRPPRDLLDLALHGLRCLHHRSGTVDGEGDGAGVLTDIPRAIWADHVGEVASDPRFAVAPVFVPPRPALAGRARVRPARRRRDGTAGRAPHPRAPRPPRPRRAPRGARPRGAGAARAR